MQSVAACTTTHVDRVRGGQFYAAELGIDFDWHNDHDAYFHTQDFINYLNFWIPIQKPKRDRSGISVVPHDALVPNHYFAMGLAAVGLGIARHALDTFIETAQTRTLAPTRTTMRTQPLIQQQFGQAEAVLRSARAFLIHTVATAWQSILATGNPMLIGTVGQVLLGLEVDEASI